MKKAKKNMVLPQKNFEDTIEFDLITTSELHDERLYFPNVDFQEEPLDISDDI